MIEMYRTNLQVHTNIYTICHNIKVMLIKTYQKEAKLDKTHLSVIYDNTKQETVNSNKLLVVIID